MGLKKLRDGVAGGDERGASEGNNCCST